jgi:catechol 2,3-dioxygenase
MTEAALDILAADTAMGAVTLRVADIEAMTRYYRDGVSLRVLNEGESSVVLGRGLVPVVILQHAPELKHASQKDAGLYHTAIVFETEEALAGAVYSVATNYPNTFTGSSDHVVSKAFYFTDPEGNGVELYWDRDRSTWSWIHGTLEMGTMYLDPNAFLQENLTAAAIADPIIGGAKVGHVHLQVGDIESARDFYITNLGFEKTVEIPGSALFVSAGGYHHHMAMNVWHSRGAGKRPYTLGLGQIDIQVPTTDDIGAMVERMKHNGMQIRDDGQTVSVDDPWANLIRVTAAE